MSAHQPALRTADGASPAAPRPASRVRDDGAMTAAQLATRHVWKRRVAKYSRWLHIYVSMASFALVFFFAITGITLNHPDWMNGAERTAELHGQLETAWMRPGAAEPDKLAIVEALRRTHHITGAVADFRVEDSDLTVAFKGPGYAADLTIDRATGKYDGNESKLGFLAIVNDLHKGRDTGTVWKGLIDVSAAVLAFVSLTGLVLLYFLHKHRMAGFMLLLIGAALSYVMYVAWVQ
jgi:hypothetical protein